MCFVSIPLQFHEQFYMCFVPLWEWCLGALGARLSSGFQDAVGEPAVDFAPRWPVADGGRARPELVAVAAARLELLERLDELDEVALLERRRGGVEPGADGAVGRADGADVLDTQVAGGRELRGQRARAAGCSPSVTPQSSSAPSIFMSDSRRRTDQPRCQNVPHS